MFKYIFFINIFLFISCNYSINNDRIDSFISKYQNENFIKFENSSISFRSRNGGENIYMINSQEENYPVYIVHFDAGRKEVTNIDRTLLEKVNCKNYFSDEKIKDLMNEFMKYDFSSISSDKRGNIFISPFSEENAPFFLRIKNKTNEKIIKKGFVYVLYKDNWYINK
jgi:hypothetical protein